MTKNTHGNGYLYLYYFKNDMDASKTGTWACKIGSTKGLVKSRVHSQCTEHHSSPIIGLEVFCEHPFKLENYVHKRLSEKRIDREWYLTNIKEVREICNDYINMSVISYSMRDISDTIRLTRKKRGMTQAELGAKVGVLQKVISNIETGNDSIRIKTINKVLSALGLLIYLYPSD